MRGSPNRVFKHLGVLTARAKRLGSLAGIIFVAWQIVGIVQTKTLTRTVPLEFGGILFM